MPRTDLEHFHRQIVLSQAPAHRRIFSLGFLSKPSLAFLRRVAADTTAPGRLRALAVERMGIILAEKQLATQTVSAIKGTTQDDNDR
jgi:hypothetical protein